MYRLVLATQPCTLASTTGYRDYRPIRSIAVLSLFAILVSEDRNRPADPSGDHLVSRLVTYLLNLQFCTLASTTGYRVYRLVPTTQSCTLASTTGCRVYRLVLATQPCTLASTTRYRVYRLVLATQPSSTTAYRVYRLVLATQPCTLASTTGYRVYRLVLATQPCALASTYRLQSILTGC